MERCFGQLPVLGRLRISEKDYLCPLMLQVFRLGSDIPVPRIDRAILQEVFSGELGLLSLFGLFSGGEELSATLPSLR